MNDINPNNYDGATVTVVGRAGGEPQSKFEGKVVELSIAVGKGYKKDGEWVDTGTDWYTLSATPQWAEENWPQVGKGDKVRVDGARLESREYTKRDGGAGLALNLRYGDLRVVEAKNSSADEWPED
jgi:single-stranded DNA-binding protein